MDYFEILKSLIPTGEENAVHMKPLAEKIDVTERELRRIIQDARCQQKMEICSSNKGYFFPIDDLERNAHINKERKRAISGFNSIKYMRNKLNNTKGQLSLMDTMNGTLDSDGDDRGKEKI